MSGIGLGSRRGNRAGIGSLMLASITVLVLLVAGASAACAATLDRVRQTGKLTLGYRVDARPFSYVDDAGKPTGYSIALCEQIANRVKTELKLPNLAVTWVPVTLEGRFRALQEGKIDLLCGADTETLSRRKDVSFSISTFPAGIGAVVRARGSEVLRKVLNRSRQARQIWRGDPARTLLSKTNFAALVATTSEDALKRRLIALDLDATVVPVDSYEAGIQRVLGGTSDVFFGDRQILIEAVSRNPARNDLMVLTDQFTYETVALALARDDEDFRLLVDQTLSGFYNSRAFYDEYTRWFGKPPASTIAFFTAASLPD